MIFARRASTILYNFLLSNNKQSGYWLIPLNTCPIVPITFQSAGVGFKFVDIDPYHFCIDEKLVYSVLMDPQCQGMLYIYTYGMEYEAESFFQTLKLKRENFLIVEDKCLSVPSFETMDASPSADITLFSTGYGKVVDIGYGGFALTSREINYKLHTTAFQEEAGEQIETDYKEMQDLGLKMLDPGIHWIDDRELPVSLETYKQLVSRHKTESLNQKKEINTLYKTVIPQELWLSMNEEAVDTWRFNILLDKNRDRIIKEIFSKNLFASMHYRPANLLFDAEVLGSGVHANKLHNQIINLFNDKYITNEQAQQSATTIMSLINI